MTLQTNNPINKLSLAEALAGWARVKPGFDKSDYGIGPDFSYADYKKDYNLYKKNADFNRRFIVSDIMQILEPLDDETIKGCIYTRLEITDNEKGSGYKIGYTVGQYFPTEYQYGLRETLQSLINSYLFAIALPYKQIKKAKTKATGKLGDEKKTDRDLCISWHLKEENNEIYQIVHAYIGGEWFSRKIWMEG